MISEVDVDGNESINFTEFLDLMIHGSKTFDANGEKEMLNVVGNQHKVGSLGSGEEEIQIATTGLTDQEIPNSVSLETLPL